jgi:gamma-glutamylcyclotransferase (GGCT)/AIG2-like uncharacterized protein YtfP
MPAARAIHLFSYGTLQFESVQMKSFGRLLKGRSDAMQGYRRDMLEITDADVIATSGERFHPVVSKTGDSADEVQGMVFSMTSEELEAADRYEVADYKRIEVTLKSGLTAFVYVRA